jgi:hypothetical protein
VKSIPVVWFYAWVGLVIVWPLVSWLKDGVKWFIDEVLKGGK